MLPRTAKSCGPDAPALASSWRSFASPTGFRQNLNPQATVTTSRSPGRARRKPLKPLRAGMPGCSGGPVVTNSCAFYTLRTRLRVHWAPGIPHALMGGRIKHNSGASRRGNAEWRLERRHCEERLVRRSSTSEGGSDRSNPLSMLRHGLLRGACHRAALCADPLARDDGLRSLASWLFEISTGETTTSSSLRTCLGRLILGLSSAVQKPCVTLLTYPPLRLP
jgi:hypothetical protein